MGKLKIPSLAADLRTHENARALRLCKPRRIAVALEQREILVKQRGLDVDLRQQFLLHRDRSLGRTRDQQDFLIRGQGTQQPGEPDIGRLSLAERMQVRPAFGKPGHVFAGVPE